MVCYNNRVEKMRIICFILAIIKTIRDTYKELKYRNRLYNWFTEQDKRVRMESSLIRGNQYEASRREREE